MTYDPNSCANLADEVNPVDRGMQDEFLRGDTRLETVHVSDSRLAKIVRLRLLTDRGCPFYDLSYCWGRLADGTPVRVRFDTYQFPRKGLTRAIVSEFQRNGRHAKRMGALDAISLLR